MSVDLQTEYHRQETQEYCGAACAQMILHQLYPTNYIDQTELYNYIHDPQNRGEDGWAADPDGLNSALNHYDVRPAFGFDILTNTDIDIITRQIVWTIFRWGVAPAVPIFYGKHWVIITGYIASRDPINSADTNYTIETLLMNNPYPRLPDTFVPPHFNAVGNLDDCNNQPRGTISLLEIVSDPTGRVRNWQDDILTRIGMDPDAPFESKWKDLFLAVCDPKHPPKKYEKPIDKAPRNHYEKIMTKEMAAELAMTIIKGKALKNDNVKLFELLEKTKAGKPVLVMRIDKDNDYYYIVPIIGHDNNIVALIRIDALNGDLRESAFTKNKEYPLLFKPLTPQEIIAAIGNKIKIGKKETLAIYPEGLNISSTLVWEPCLESFTLYLPFYLVHYGKKRIYVRIDGAVFTKLTTKVRGM